MRIILSVGVLLLFAVAGAAHAKPGGKDKPPKGPALSHVGSYISNYEIEFISGPIGPNGEPTFVATCADLLDDPDNPNDSNSGITFCESAQLVIVNADGTVNTKDNNASAGANSGSAGEWTASTRSTFQSRQISIQYNPLGGVDRYVLLETRAEAFPDFSGSTGTFVSRSYPAGTDPLDPSTPYIFENTGSFETRRIE